MLSTQSARIFNIQKYSIYDGPGIRTLVFFQGCPLRCLWCSNPEGQTTEPRILFRRNLCVNCGACVPACPERLHTLQENLAVHEVRRDGCSGCGACVDACPQRALAVCGRDMSIAQILDVVMQDHEFYLTSGGGVTVGGGEPLMQWQAVRDLLRACREQDVHTALETSGFAEPEALVGVAPFVNTFLYDIKQVDSKVHQRLTGVGNEKIFRNLTHLLDSEAQVRVRLPLINGCNADENSLAAVADFLAPYRTAHHLLGVDILPYHAMGVQKYAHLGMEYGISGNPRISNVQLDRVHAFFLSGGFNVSLVRH